MAPEERYQYEIDLRQGDLYIQLLSRDVEFIARQMQRWYEVMLDDTYVPVTIPSGDAYLAASVPIAVIPEPEAPQPPVAEPQPAPQNDGVQEALMGQIRLLQDQVERLMVEKAQPPKPEVFADTPATFAPEMQPPSNPIEAFASPAHFDVQPRYDEPPTVSAGFEQAVENPSMTVQNPAPVAPVEIPQTHAEPTFTPDGSFEQGPVENTPEPVMDFSQITVLEEAPAPTQPEEGNDLDSLLDSLMTDLEKKSESPTPTAPMEAPAATVEVPSAEPVDASFEAVFSQAMTDMTEVPAWDPPAEGDPSVPPELAADAFMPETPSPVTSVELPSFGEPPESAFEAPTATEPEALTPSSPTSEWDDLARLKPDEEFVVKSSKPAVVHENQIHEEDESELNPPFPTPEIAEKAEKGFGIAGPPPTDDPKIRKLSMEALQGKHSTMDDFISPFPKSKEEIEREAQEAAQIAAERQKLAAAKVQQQASSAIEEDLFAAFGGPQTVAPAAPSVDEDIFGAFGAPSAPAPAASAPMPEPSSGGVHEDDVFGAFGSGGFGVAPEPEAQPAPAAVAVAVQPVEHKGSLPKVEALSELCDMAPRATTGSDFMLLTAFFLKRFKQIDKFALKDINTQLLRSGLTPVNHALLENVIAQGLVQLMPDLTGTAHAAEYMLTDNGDTYVDSLLNY